MNKEQSETILRLLKAAIGRPHEWSGDEVTATHTPSGLRLWIGNGPSHLNIERPEFIRFGFWQRRWLWKEMKPIREKLTNQAAQNAIERLSQ